jgi:hypothetical protein
VTGVGPGSPVISAGMGPPETGGDKRIEHGMPVMEAYELAARESGETPRTIFRWAKRVRGCPVVATDDQGSHFHRNHRYPGTRPVAPARFSALASRRPRARVAWALAASGATECVGPLR